jgi:hypothetical protein
LLTNSGVSTELRRDLVGGEERPVGQRAPNDEIGKRQVQRVACWRQELRRQQYPARRMAQADQRLGPTASRY